MTRLFVLSLLCAVFFGGIAMVKLAQKDGAGFLVATVSFILFAGLASFFFKET